MKRNISIDILKLISMLMVVFLHAIIYGMKSVKIEAYSSIFFQVSFLQAICIVAVNCFVLISGYFYCERGYEKITLSKLKNRYKKLLPFWVSVVTYSMGGGIYYQVFVYIRSHFL